MPEKNSIIQDKYLKFMNDMIIEPNPNAYFFQ